MSIADQLRAEGETKGRTEGVTEGVAKGKAESLLLILKARSVHVSDDVRARIVACSDAERLDHWLRRAVVIDDAQALLES